MRSDHVLFTALCGVVSVVLAVWLMGAIGAAWGVVLALLVALAATAVIVLVTQHELADDDDGEHDEVPMH